MARPKGSKKRDHKRRSAQMTFWVTPTERDRIAANAERAGVTISAFVRGLALGEKLRPKPKVRSDELTYQLARIANNLTQLSRGADQGFVDGAEHLDHVLLRVDRTLQHWTSDARTPEAISPTDLELLQHEGAIINQLARRSNKRELVSENTLCQALQGLTEKLRPFCP